MLSQYSTLSLIVFAIQPIVIQHTFAQSAIENWNTFVDPDKRFTLFYPPNLQAKGKENFLSSTDLKLTNPNSSRQFKITISYSTNDTNLNYTGNKESIPYNELRNLEQQIKPAFQIYNVVQNNSESYNLYGFPTAGNIIDYTKHGGESGRMLNVLEIVKGKNSFFVSYSNNVEGLEDFYLILAIYQYIFSFSTRGFILLKS